MQAGDVIPVDGEVIDGVAEVDESAVTGESAPVIRESGGDRSAVFGGTRVLSDWLKVKVTADLGHGIFAQISELIAESRRQGEPDRALAHPAAPAAGGADRGRASPCFVPCPPPTTGLDLTALLIALFGAMLPTATAGLRSVIGMVGMGRLAAVNMIAKSGAAVEAAASVDTLLLDKTGTITLGDRRVETILPLPGIAEREAAEAAYLASLERRDARGQVDRGVRPGSRFALALVAGSESLPPSRSARRPG